MTTEIIPDLWGSISLDAMSPLAILRNQADRLTVHTNGLLTGDVRVATEGIGATYTFVIVAPQLRGYRYDLFSAFHEPDLVYPVRVKFRPWQDADYVREFGDLPPRFLSFEDQERAKKVEAREASTTEGFIKIVGEVLTSSYTQAVVSSLIVKSNEAAPQPAA